MSKRHGTYYEGHMFPLLVKEELDLWPEKDLRRRVWVCPTKYCVIELVNFTFKEYIINSETLILIYPLS